jgi:hypothetical protein
MMRLLVLCALIGAAIFYMREPVQIPAFMTADNPLVPPTPPTPAPAPVAAGPAPATTPAPAAAPAPVAIVSAQQRDSVPAIASPVAPPAAAEPAAVPAKPVARRASPIPTSPVPLAITVLESPSAGLPKETSAAPRLPVTETLPDGTTRAAGGSSGPTLPIARVLARRPIAATPEAPAIEAPPAAAKVVAAPPPVPPVAAVPVARPSQADAYFKNAARILAETEIPK